jgi:shikimate dehydrogenase
MHTAVYRELRLPDVYEALPTREDELPMRIEALRKAVYAGLNVTVPHKVSVLPFVDRLDASAFSVGAANTLVCGTDGEIVAHNTDVPALTEELALLAPPPGSRALVLGGEAAQWGEEADGSDLTRSAMEGDREVGANAR